VFGIAAQTSAISLLDVSFSGGHFSQLNVRDIGKILHEPNTHQSAKKNTTDNQPASLAPA